MSNSVVFMDNILLNSLLFYLFVSYGFIAGVVMFVLLSFCCYCSQNISHSPLNNVSCSSVPYPGYKVIFFTYFIMIKHQFYFTVLLLFLLLLLFVC